MIHSILKSLLKVNNTSCKLRISSCESLAFPLPPNQAVADFRKRFKLALMHVAGVGLANIACSAGKPFGNRSTITTYEKHFALAYRLNVYEGRTIDEHRCTVRWVRQPLTLFSHLNDQ